MNDVLNAQQEHWENTFAEKPDMFGASPSEPAKAALVLFTKEGAKTVLELGSGQGRDTLFFGKGGLKVFALDYSEAAIQTIAEKAEKAGLSALIQPSRHDIRRPLPFEEGSVDACFSHMLFCMALTSAELECLCGEIRRVLKPNGLNIYTVRHTGDPHYQKGIHRGEDMYAVGGFIVHFFSREKVEKLAKGFEVVDIREFEEGGLPRKLFRVTLRKI
jgi:SAM-dependent methyltransferase